MEESHVADKLLCYTYCKWSKDYSLIDSTLRTVPSDIRTI